MKAKQGTRRLLAMVLVLCMMLPSTSVISVFAADTASDEIAAAQEPAAAGTSSDTEENGDTRPLAILPEDPSAYIQLRFYERDLSEDDQEIEILDYRQTVKLGEGIREPDTDRLHLEDNEMFLGWQRGDTQDDEIENEYFLPGHIITQDDFDAAEQITEDGNTLSVLKLYPDIALIHYVYFHDDYDSIYDTEKAVPTGNPDECLVDSAHWPVPGRQKTGSGERWKPLTLGNFVAWVDVDLYGTTLQGDSYVNFEEFKNRVAADPEYLKEHTVTVDTNIHALASTQIDNVNDYNVDLWAYYDDQFWVTFNTLGGTFVESLRLDPNYVIDLSDLAGIFADEEHNHNYSSSYTYQEPTKMGYTFGGWSTALNEDGTGGDPDNKVENTYKVTAGTTFYAIWEPSLTEYTITYLGEAPDLTPGAGEATDLSGTNYDTVSLKTVKAQADVGQTICATDAADLNTNSGNPYYFADLKFYERDDARNANSSVTIAADGSSVLYVYYTLKIFDVGFDIYPYYYSTDGSTREVANFDEPPAFTINGKKYTGEPDYSDTDITIEYSIKIKLGQDISGLWPLADDFEQKSYQGDGRAHYLQGWRGSTLQATNVIYASSVIIEGTPHKADWTTSQLRNFTMNYYFESTDQTSTDKEPDRILGKTIPKAEMGTSGNVTRHRGTDGIYYDLSEDYSYNFFYHTQWVWGHKAIEGYIMGGDDFESYPSYKDSGYVSTVDLGSDNFLVEFFYDRKAYTLNLVNPGSDVPEMHSVKHGFDITNYVYDGDANYLEEPDRPAGYDEYWKFIGWYDVKPEEVVYNPRDPANNTKPYYDADSDEPCIMPMSDLTLYAYWYRPTIHYKFEVTVNELTGQTQVFEGDVPEGTVFSTVSGYEEARVAAEAYVQGQPDKSIVFRGFYYVDENGYADLNSRAFNPDIEIYDDINVRAVFAQAESYSLTYLPGPFMDETSDFDAYVKSSKNYAPNQDSGPRLLTYEQVITKEDGTLRYEPKESCYIDGKQAYFFGYWVESDKDGNILPEYLDENGALKKDAVRYYPGDMIPITKETYVIPYFVKPLEQVSVTYHWSLTDDFEVFFSENNGLNFVLALDGASGLEDLEAVFKGKWIPVGYQFWGWSTTPVEIVETDSMLDNTDTANYPGSSITIFSAGDGVRYDADVDDSDDSTEESPNHFYAVWTRVKAPAAVLGSFSISKTVTGEGAETDDNEFTFVVTLDDQSVTGVYSNGGIRFDGGKAEVKLKNGESITVEGLPAGTSYTVTEALQDELKDHYQVTSTGDTGTVSANETAKAAFTNVIVNDKEPTPPPVKPDPKPDPGPAPSGGGSGTYRPNASKPETKAHYTYMFGYPDGTFGPTRNMTRAEAAQMFYNLMDAQNVRITVHFSDVPDNAWYAKAVNTLASLDIVVGVGDNKFEPNRPVTRAEFVTMVTKFANKTPGGTSNFSDVKQSDWFYDYVGAAVKYSWVSGYPDGTFLPNNNITRAEAVSIMNNFLGRAADVSYVDTHVSELKYFSDVYSSYWAYYAIREATNDHYYTKLNAKEAWSKLK